MEQFSLVHADTRWPTSDVYNFFLDNDCFTDNAANYYY
jgi:hypothetical protein